jgi:hypothetical protein
MLSSLNYRLHSIEYSKLMARSTTTIELVFLDRAKDDNELIEVDCDAEEEIGDS